VNIMKLAMNALVDLIVPGDSNEYSQDEICMLVSCTTVNKCDPLNEKLLFS